MRSAVEVRNVSVHYPRASKSALTDVSFAVEQGETLLLLGASGSGKSTIGLCITGLVPASVPARMEGSIFLGGRDASELTIAERTAQVGMVFQDPEAQFCMLTVQDEVAFGLENLAVPREEMEGRIAEALALVGLGERRRERVDRLSQGQKQRLALASALARRPSILFLDEPTANLDPMARHDFFQLLAGLRRERPDLTIIVVEHLLDDLIAIVDRVLLLGPGGHVITAGDPATVFELQGDDLHRLGIWLPQVTALAAVLRLAGVPVGQLPLTVEQAANEFERLIVARSLPMSGHVWSTVGRSADGSACAISVRDLSFRYPTGTEALHHISLDVPTGSFYALVGPNGSGKTTLASHFVEIFPSAPGQVRIFGDDISDLSTAQITDRVGYVFQNPEHQFVESNVEDELSYSLRLRGRPPDEVERIVTDLLDSFGLSSYRKLSPFSLSQGEKRRLSVATMLAVGQRLLVLDEPTFGQDRRTAGSLMERLQALRLQGVSIFIITHDMQLVADYAEQAAVLVDGEVAYAGSMPELFSNDELMAAAALRPPSLHRLARELRVSFSNGTSPTSIREWQPFFGLGDEGEGQPKTSAPEGSP